MRAIFTLAALVLLPLQALAAELLMVERDGCHWCEKWNREIAHIYPKTEEGRIAPLRRTNIKALPKDIRFSSTVIYTPTFVLVEEGQEQGRIEGYAGADFFWPQLSGLLAEHSEGK